MRILLPAIVLALILPAEAQSFRDAVATRNPIIWNSQENEVGVIHGVTSRGGETAAIVQPTQKFIDLGYYDIAIPASALRPRPRGGWYTSIPTDQLANIPPYTESGRPRFFQRSGVP